METQLLSENKSLNSILTLLAAVDDGMIELSQSDMAETLGSLKDKVDGIYEVISRMKSEQDRLKSEIDNFTAKKKALENAEQRLKDYVVFAMDQDGNVKLQGNRYTLQMQSRELIKVKPFTSLSTTQYVELNTLSPGVVKREYKFDTTLFKKLAAERKEVLDSYGEVSKTTFPVFRVRKEI